MANDPPEFTDDEVKAFEALSDQERADIERFVKWHGQKANPANPRPASPPSPENSGRKGFDLADLKALLADQDTLSILDYLRAQKPKSPKGARENDPPPAKPKLGGFLRRT